MSYLTVLAKIDLLGDLKLLRAQYRREAVPAYIMRIGRFHETWNGSQISAEHRLTAYNNYLRSYQTPEKQPPIGALGREGSI
ncbi:hypothetical protein [Halococcus salifodinae]|nr:hypothetical protein [Halococcus salifodinae]